MAAVQLILVIFIIVIGMYIFGIGTDFLDDIGKQADALIRKQNEVPDATYQDRGNFAKNTGTRVCDLDITFHATAWNYDPTKTLNAVEWVFGNINIFHGKITGDILPPLLVVPFTGILTPVLGITSNGHLAGNTDIFDYQWYCTGATGEVSLKESDTPPSSTTGGSTGQTEICRTGARGEKVCVTASFLDLFRWNLEKNTREGIDQLALLGFQDRTDRETITVNFFGKSLTGGKDLVSPSQANKGTNANPFTKQTQLPRDVEFPVDYQITVFLKDVTEDNYLITFWDEDYEQNGKPVGHRFTVKDICKPGLETC
jgi:hypothetical protein